MVALGIHGGVLRKRLDMKETFRCYSGLLIGLTQKCWLGHMHDH